MREFQRTWRAIPLIEKPAAQEHVLDLCAAPGVPTPRDTILARLLALNLARANGV